MKLPPAARILPRSWGQPVHSRQKNRYVYSEEELRRAISDVVSSSGVDWNNGVDRVKGEFSIVIAGSFSIRSTVRIPKTASGMRLTAVGSASIMPASSFDMTTPLIEFVGSPVFKNGVSSGSIIGVFNATVSNLNIRRNEEISYPSDFVALRIYACRDCTFSNMYIHGNVEIDISERCTFSDITVYGKPTSGFAAGNLDIKSSNSPTNYSRANMFRGIYIYGDLTLDGSFDNMFSSCARLGNVALTNFNCIYNAFSACKMLSWTESALAGYNMAGSCIIGGTPTKAATSNVDTAAAAGSNNR